MKRGRKRIFYENEVRHWANEGLTVQQIADKISTSEKIIHYNSVRHFLVANDISYKKGKRGRPRKEIINK